MARSSVAAEDGADEEADAAAPKGNKRKRHFMDHKALTEIMAGMKSGKYHQGTLRVSR